MSKKNLRVNSKYSREEKEAAILAQVALDKQPDRIPVSRYNRYAKQFGLPTMNKLSLEDFELELNNQMKQLSQGPAAQVLYKVYNHKLSLYDVLGTNETHKEWQHKVHSGYTTQAENHQMILDLDRQRNRVKRNDERVTYQVNGVLQSIAHHFKDYLKTPSYKPKWSKNNNKTLVMLASDWHIGDCMEADMPNYRNRYNWKIAKKRWWKYVNSALHTAKINHVGSLILGGMGDLVTGAYMRPSNQSCIEFDYSTQVVLATKMLVDTLRVLSKYYPVKFFNVVGNHDRVGSFKANMYGDSATNIETSFIKMLHIPNVTVITRKDPHDFDLNIQGHNLLFTHGEKVKPNASNNIQNLEANANVDMLVYAHWHYYHVESNDCGRLELGLPALKGFDRYNKKITTTVASSGQTSILLTPHKTPQIIPVLFDIK